MDQEIGFLCHIRCAPFLCAYKTACMKASFTLEDSISSKTLPEGIMSAHTAKITSNCTLSLEKKVCVLSGKGALIPA